MGGCFHSKGASDIQRKRLEPSEAGVGQSNGMVSHEGPTRLRSACERHSPLVRGWERHDIPLHDAVLDGIGESGAFRRRDAAVASARLDLDARRRNAPVTIGIGRLNLWNKWTAGGCVTAQYSGR